jgi:hypothetical protein
LRRHGGLSHQELEALRSRLAASNCRVASRLPPSARIYLAMFADRDAGGPLAEVRIVSPESRRVCPAKADLSLLSPVMCTFQCLRRTAEGLCIRGMVNLNASRPGERRTVLRRWENKVAGYAVASLEDPVPRLMADVNATPIARASATSWARSASWFRWQCRSLRRCHNSLADRRLRRSCARCYAAAVALRASVEEHGKVAGRMRKASAAMCGCPKYTFLLLWHTPNEAARANRLVHVLRPRPAHRP